MTVLLICFVVWCFVYLFILVYIIDVASSVSLLYILDLGNYVKIKLLLFYIINDLFIINCLEQFILSEILQS